MPSCAAPGCSSRSDKGEVLKIFPRKDLYRRQIWIDRVNRPGWTPTKYSALCERHFDRDQWELPREDGKRKLKSTAVPSIFCVEHPPEDDLVANEHAYCILGYKQLFDRERDYSDGEDESDILPIEHIKVEVDENENEAENVMGEEDELDIENIQCTPDIKLFMCPESSEPDPIETVECEDGNVNAFTSDPSNDPLAFSSEDAELADQVVPHFSHSTKYLFVTKDKKMVSSVPVVAEGEPVIASEPPKLKPSSPQLLVPSNPSILISPSKLHKGTTILLRKLNSSPPNLTAISKSSDLNLSTHARSRPPKLTPMPQLLVPKEVLNVHFPNGSSPPKLAPISKPASISLPKPPFPPKLTPVSTSPRLPVPIRPAVPKLVPISKSLKVIYPKGYSSSKLIETSNSQKLPSPKLKLVSSSVLSSPVKLKLVSRPINQVDTENISKSVGSQSNSSPATSNNGFIAIKPKVVSIKPKLVKAPKYLHSPFSSDVISEEDLTFLNFNLAKDQPLPRSHLITNELLIPASSIPCSNESNGFKIKNDGQNLVVNSMNDGLKLKNILSEHHYTKKQSCDGSSLKETQSKLNPSNGSRKNLGKFLGNNHVKQGLWINDKNRDINKTIIKSTPLTFGNVGFKTKVPFATGLMSKLEAGSLKNASSVVVLNPFGKSNSSKSLYPNGKTFTHGQNIELSVCPVCKVAFLSPAYLQSHMKHHEDHVVSDEDEESKSYKDQDTKIIKRSKYSQGNRKANKLKDKSYESGVQKLENDVVLIPNLQSFKNSNDDEFIRLTNLVSTIHSDEDQIYGDTNVPKRFCVGEVEEENSSLGSSTETQNLKDKGLVIDKSGRRLSLRKKIKTFKSKSYARQINKRPRSTSSITLKKNPIVLLSKIDLNQINNNKEIEDSITVQSTEISDDDSGESWKGWDESCSGAGRDLINAKLAAVSAQCVAVKKPSRSKSKREGISKGSANNNTKNKKPSRINKRDLKESISQLSQNSSRNKPSSQISKVKCTKCGLLIQKSNFKRHMLLHTELEYSCKLCNKKFEKSFLLRRHVTKDHKVLKQFSCLRRDCSRKFETKRDLEKHMRSHRK